MVSVFLSVSILFCSIVLNNNSEAIRRFSQCRNRHRLFVGNNQCVGLPYSALSLFRMPIVEELFPMRGRRLGRSKPASRGMRSDTTQGRPAHCASTIETERPSIKEGNKNRSIACNRRFTTLDVPPTNVLGLSNGTVVPFFEWLFAIPPYQPAAGVLWD